MTKNIEWLKENIGELPNTDTVFVSEGKQYVDTGVPVLSVYDLLDQLDKPETLSQTWIEQNHFCVENWAEDLFESDGETSIDHTPQIKVIAVQDLQKQNLLVPKQELPVIPKFVAEWISFHRGKFDLYPALKRLENNLLSWEDVYYWYRKNTHKFVNAYLTGEYEVEEEPKYVVELPTNRENVFDEPDFYRPRAAIGRMANGLLTIFKTRDGTNLKLHDKYLLTEQEIKDYDPRYWAFRKPVEEFGE